MAAENISLNITGNALQQLQKIETQVGKISGSFGKLRNVVAGIALGGFITNTLRLADAMDDLAKATGFSLATIDSLSKALQANGGNADDATGIITRFSRSLEEARTEGGKALTAFQRLGFSISDLSENDEKVFGQLLDALAKMPPSAERTAMSMALIGKNINTIDFKGLTEDQKKFYEESKKNAPAIKAAADLQQKFNTTLTKLSDALMVSIKPLAEYINKIPQEKINSLIDSFTKMAVAIAGLAGAAKLLSSIAAAFLTIKSYVALITTGSATLALTWKILGKQVGYFTKALAAAVGVFAKFKEVAIFVMTLLTTRLKFVVIGFGSILAGVLALVTALYAVREALKFVFNIDIFAPFIAAWDYIIKKAREYFNLTKKFDARDFGAREATSADSTVRFPGDDKVEAPNADADPLKEFRQGIEDITKAYRDQQEQLIKNINLETVYLGMSNDQAEIERQVNEVIERQSDAVKRLKEERAKLLPEQKEQIALIDAQISQLNAQLEQDKRNTATAVENQQKRKNAIAEVTRQIELQKLQLTDDAAIKALRDQIALIQLYGDELENANIALEVSQSLEQALLSLRQQELDLIAKKGQLTQEQFDREMAQIEALRQAAYKRAGDEIDAKTDVQQAQRIADEDATLSIKKYLDELEKGVTPAKQSLESVQSVFGNMNNALETFVRSGKFKFKDFALSVIQDLLLIQAKAAMTKIFSAIIGGIFPGLAEGGPAKKGQPYIVGEKGPELFVPNTGGTVVPNNAMNKGMSTGAVNAPIQNTYITNNINAVDAKSVAQLFAENRKTLLGTVRMAEKEMPYMGRT